MVKEEKLQSLPKGVTLPPPEVRIMIEKTAGYVARNGVAFEQRVKAREVKNDKFQFLLDKDPYNGYYRHILQQIKEGKFKGSRKNDSKGDKKDGASGNDEKDTDFIMNIKQLKYLPGEFVSKISPVDLEVIKLVARFTAVNGERFLIWLKKLSKGNIQLTAQTAFLDEGHSMHKIFNFYLECYRRILTSQDEIRSLIGNFDQTKFLDRCFARAEHDKKVKSDLSKELKDEEQKRLYYASIDWQDFSVVQKIEFTDLDDAAALPAPLEKSELEFRSLVQKRASTMIEEAPPDYDAENNKEMLKSENVKARVVDSDNSDKKIHRPVPKGVKILSAGESRLKRQREKTKGDSVDPITGERLLRCPLTGKLIPESKFAKHISILLLDPRYKEEKSRYEAKFRYAPNISNEQVYENIKSMMKDKEQEDGANPSKKRRKVIWNGTSNTIAQTKAAAERGRDKEEEKKAEAERIQKEHEIGPY